jgi:hypothetical protein
VLSESYSPQQHEDYIAANAACKALVDTDKYGDFIKLVEYRKDNQYKVIWSIKWE